MPNIPTILMLAGVIVGVITSIVDGYLIATLVSYVVRAIRRLGPWL